MEGLHDAIDAHVPNGARVLTIGLDGAAKGRRNGTTALALADAEGGAAGGPVRRRGARGRARPGRRPAGDPRRASASGSARAVRSSSAEPDAEVAGARPAGAGRRAPAPLHPRDAGRGAGQRGPRRHGLAGRRRRACWWPAPCPATTRRCSPSLRREVDGAARAAPPAPTALEEERDALQARVVALEARERELRERLLDAHELLGSRDAEVARLLESDREFQGIKGTVVFRAGWRYWRLKGLGRRRRPGRAGDFRADERPGALRHRHPGARPRGAHPPVRRRPAAGAAARPRRAGGGRRRLARRHRRAPARLRRRDPPRAPRGAAGLRGACNDGAARRGGRAASASSTTTSCPARAGSTSSWRSCDAHPERRGGRREAALSRRHGPARRRRDLPRPHPAPPVPRLPGRPSGGRPLPRLPGRDRRLPARPARRVRGRSGGFDARSATATRTSTSACGWARPGASVRYCPRASSTTWSRSPAGAASTSHNQALWDAALAPARCAATSSSTTSRTGCSRSTYGAVLPARAARSAPEVALVDADEDAVGLERLLVERAARCGARCARTSR